MTRQLFVTTSLPYANAPFHVGHMMEYIQADIWVRFQRMQGHEVHFVCADDAHGAPIMIAAEKAGKTPQQFVTEIAGGRRQYLDGFHIGFDNWHSTDGPENHQLAQDIYRALRRQGLIAERTIEQFFDPVKGMFLPDRYIKGECPRCGAKDQYGDSCEVCGAVYTPTELKNPYSTLTGATPVLKASEHYFFQLSAQRCIDFLQEWTGQPGRLQTEVLNKIKEWFAVDEHGHGALSDWDISRDAPYFGIEIPDAPGKYFYVWLDAPIGYLAALKNYCDKSGRDYDALMADPALEQIDFNPDDFIARVNSDLVGKYINIASRAAGFIAKRFGGTLSGDVGVEGLSVLDALRAGCSDIERLYEEREFGKALREIMLLADRVNEYVDQHKPWELAKQAGQDAVLHDVCTVCIEAFRLLTIYLKPVLPALAAQVEAFLRIAPLRFADAQRSLGEHTIGEYKHLMQRVDAKQLDALFEPPIIELP